MRGLDLSENGDRVLTAGFNEPDQTRYDLYGVVNHSGDLSNGHYTAVVRQLESRAWFNCDDSSVNMLQPEREVIVTKDAYLLFYIRSDDVGR